MICPEDIGTSLYVLVQFNIPDDRSLTRRPCSVGIFSCNCTANFEAVARSAPISPSTLNFVVLGADYTDEMLAAVDPATLIQSQTYMLTLPTITTYSTCDSCSISLVANFNSNYNPYLNVAIS